MRGDAVYRDFALSAAHEAVEERLEDSSADPDVLPELEEIAFACLRSSASVRRSMPVSARSFDAVTAALNPMLVPLLAVAIHV
jgi:hypothetical protein